MLSSNLNMMNTLYLKFKRATNNINLDVSGVCFEMDFTFGLPVERFNVFF